MKTAPEIATLLAWLVPGAGHLYLGRRAQGLLYLVVINTTFAIGAHASALECVSRTYHPVALLGQIGAGGPTLAALYLDHPATRSGGLVDRARGFYEARRPPPPTIGRVANPFLDIGLLYTTIAGLLNLLVIQEAYNRACESRRT